MHRHCLAGGKHHIGKKALVAPHKRCGRQAAPGNAFGNSLTAQSCRRDPRRYGCARSRRTSFPRQSRVRAPGALRCAAASPRQCARPADRARGGYARPRGRRRCAAATAICSATVQHTPGMERLMRAPKRVAREPRGVHKETDRSARACMRMHDGVRHRQRGLHSGERLADDRRKKIPRPPCSACPAAPRRSAAECRPRRKSRAAYSRRAAARRSLFACRRRSAA